MRIYRFNCLLKCSSVKNNWRYIILCIKSLTYNTFDSTLESAFEPLFYFVDFAVRWLGVAFVCVVVLLIASVVIIFYFCVIPFVLEVLNPFFAFIHLFYGHYLLLMIAFHYFKATTTKPGRPPEVVIGIPVTSVCKKCILPKPPRSHHCSVCRMCCLKMDHHCPWINNCVGHFNHRYFISFCIFMCLGTIYVSISSWTLFSDCFHVNEKVANTVAFFQNLFGQEAEDDLENTLTNLYNENSCSAKSRSYNTSIVYLWILCSAVTLALGCLTAWHVMLISKGETSIERLINYNQRKRMSNLGQIFINPFDFGYVQNWKQLLGFVDRRSFFLRVLLPSTHLPTGDGITWTSKNHPAFVA